MRILSRLFVLGTLLAATAAPSAMAENVSVATLSPNKGGTYTAAAPTTFSLTTSTPDSVYDPTGRTRILAVKTNLPEQLLFNSLGFPTCKVTAFLESKICPRNTKLGTAVVQAYGGPDILAVQATADLYFGSGFAILARVRTESPAVIDEAVVGDLRSSLTTGYGLQMYIPVPPAISEPIDRVYPIVRSVTATVRPLNRKVKVPGRKRKLTVPLAGLGPCTGPMNFEQSIVYGDINGNINGVPDGAATQARCRK